VIINDVDLGGRPAHVVTQGGQLLASATVAGSSPVVWSQGGDVEKLDVEFSIEAWQALGGQSANSLAALRLLEAQLEELRSNPEMQPVYLQPYQTAQPSPVYPVRSDSHDGWYWLDALAYDPETYNQRGAVEARATFTRTAPPLTPLGVRWAGGALTSTYTSTPLPLISYPVGSTQVPATALSRAGGEGTIPVSVLASGSSMNPARFAKPGTVAGLFTGGVKVYDTITAGSNAVPAAGAGFANSNWVLVYGTKHGLSGDLVITNGLLLLRFNQGGNGTPDLYLWNTQGTAGWNFVAQLSWKDNSGNPGAIRGFDLVRVGPYDARADITLGTSAGNYASFAVRLSAGHYAASVAYTPLTQNSSTAYALDLAFQTAVKAVVNSTQAYDVATQGGPTNVGLAADAGWAVGIGSTANEPLVGLLWQNPPNAGQPGAGSTTDVGFGETTSPNQNVTKQYGIVAAPFSTTPASLMAEAESGTLGTGWTSIADAGSSGGNAAKCASGTASGNRDIWGTSWIPPAGVYDTWVRMRVASVASSTSQMQIGLWDDDGGGGSGAYVASTTYAPNAAGLSTSYVWVRICTDVTPTATHHMRFRAVTTATTTTDWFIDQAVLVPKRSATLGQGDFPADIWAQWAFVAERRLTRG
jgi:hypothetical protein